MTTADAHPRLVLLNIVPHLPSPAARSPERDADSIFEEWRGGRISSARRHLEVFVGGDRNA
jgi:hypothetical protein